MKYNYLLAIFLLNFYSYTSSAQVIDRVMEDSMYKEIERAYHLFDQFDYGAAINISDRVIDYATKTNNNHLKAKAYNVLGNTYYNTGNDSLCLDYLFKSRDYFLKSKDYSTRFRIFI